MQVSAFPQVDGRDIAALFDAAPALIAAADRCGRIVLFNARCERLTGFRREDVLGQPFLETLVPADWHDTVRARFASESPAALAAAHVNPWRTAGGGRIEIEWHCFRAEHMPEGPWIIGFGYDLEGERLARRDVELQQGLIDALFEHIPEGITIADAPDVTIRRVSRFGEAITGRQRASLEQIPADDHPAAWGLFHLDGVTPAAADELPLTRATRAGEVVTDEEWIIRQPDGSEVTILCNAGPIRDASGRITGGLIAWRDITERKRLESDLRAADRAKDEFLAAVAHELRQPLAACLGAVALMRMRQSREAGERAHAVLDRQLTHMARLIDDLLDTSRVALGTVALATQPLDLRDVVRRACESVQSLVEARRHACTVEVPAEPLTIDADPMRLQQVLGNLITNAAKYTPPGGTIRVTASADARAARVVVRDNGVGIPPEMQTRIFDLFTRASADADADGFGIGLAIVRRLVEAHGGTVTVTSDGPGRGSEFVIILPRQPGA
jgi:PAS domain S-box-containing protein